MISIVLQVRGEQREGVAFPVWKWESAAIRVFVLAFGAGLIALF